jgi:hypothetical protein
MATKAPSVGAIRAALQIVLECAVRVPESFRGGCSVGVRAQGPNLSLAFFVDVNTVRQRKRSSKINLQSIRLS